ncbi:MAG: metal-sensitive transcriptional regulator [Fusobacteriaceae bacterium]|jgi:DNA-binding FrmR family transcriptional regulator|nr:metal-sensitive transcriptional regulator [Fusobacteriaceae bacterium]
MTAKKVKTEKEHCVNDDELKRKLKLRLNRIEGQIHGVSRMIEEDKHCDDILNQAASVKAALNGVCKLILESHIKKHLLEEIKQGNDEDKVLSELLYTLNKML